MIDRRPWRVLAIAPAITAVAAPIGIHVRDDLRPRGFEVAGSGSADARRLVAEASDTDPANSVLALIRLPAPCGVAATLVILFLLRQHTRIALLLRVVMVLLGRSAWWAPAVLDRLYRRLRLSEHDAAGIRLDRQEEPDKAVPNIPGRCLSATALAGTRR
jgi:hypothetical protein